MKKLELILLSIVILTYGIFAVIFNTEIFTFINGISHNILDVFMLYMTHFGDGITASLLALLVSLYRPKWGFAMIIGLIVIGILIPGLKAYFDMPRPSIVFDQVRILGKTLKRHSFPSGHSATVITYSFIFAGLIKGPKKILVYCFALLSAFSRIYVGAHFPFDVAVGIALGFGCAILILHLHKKHAEKLRFLANTKTSRIVSTLMLIISIISIFFYNAGKDYFFFGILGVACVIISIKSFIRPGKSFQEK